MRIASVLAVGVVCGSLGAACADHAPVLVVPGRAGVPVVINGYDASYTVVEGDWGLSRPGHVPPAIVSGPLITPAPFYSGAYYPSQGRRPGYGRREVEPPANRRLPPPAPSFYREWGTQSQPLPADVPVNPPPVITATPDGQQQDQAATYNGNPQDWRDQHNPRDRHHDRRKDRRQDRREDRRHDRRKDRHHHVHRGRPGRH